MKAGRWWENLGLERKGKNDTKKLLNDKIVKCKLYQILFAWYNKEDLMGYTCGTHGREEKICIEFWWVKLKKSSCKTLEKIKTEFIEMG